MLVKAWKHHDYMNKKLKFIDKLKGKLVKKRKINCEIPEYTQKETKFKEGGLYEREN